MVDKNKKKKTTNQLHQVEISQPQQGMHTDTSAHAQPSGTYRFALNGVNESKDGNLGFITNELGNTECITIPEDYTLIGSVYLSDDEIIVFLAPINIDPPVIPLTTGIIGKITNKCTYTDILRSTCLNFDTRHPIEVTHRIRNGCENVIYFTDNHNPIREINLDSLDQYLLEGEIYNNTAADIWDCAQFKLIADYKVPVASFVQINDSGGFDMLLGTYQLAFRYLDTDLNPTNWCAITNPIPISADPYGTNEIGIREPATRISGGFNGEEHLPTTKSIDYNITNIDTSFEYLDIAMIRTVSGNGNPSDAYILDSLPISGSSIDYTLRGQIAASIPVDLDDIVIPRVPYDTAKTIEQIDQRLVLGNITSPYLDHEAFQRTANDMGVTYHTNAQSGDDAHSSEVDCGAPSGKMYFSKLSYMRDEVYALGIVWILKDGTESPVYHIPGRQKDKKAKVSSAIPDNMPTDGDPNSPAATNYSVINDPDGYTETHRSILPTAPTVSGWDSFGYTTDFISPLNGSAGYNGLHLNTENPERWQIFNTALRERVDFSPGGGGNQSFRSSGQLAYWETKDYRYPPTLGCDGKPVYPYTGDGISGPIIMDLIRHHKMPDTTLEPHFYSPDFRYPINDGNCIESLSDAAQHYAQLGQNLISEVGIHVQNIVCPPSMQDKVQGFKIVKAQRTDDNKSVVDKGLMYYNYLGFSSINPDNPGDMDDFDPNNENFSCGNLCTQFVQTASYNAYSMQKPSENGLFEDGKMCRNYRYNGLTPIGPKGWQAHLEVEDKIGNCFDSASYIGMNDKGEDAGVPTGQPDPHPEVGKSHCMFCDRPKDAQCFGAISALDASIHDPAPFPSIPVSNMNCWKCGNSCEHVSGTDPSYSSIGCGSAGLPYPHTHACMSENGNAQVPGFSPYDNFANMSFHGFKSKVDGEKDKNLLFDHIKVEKIIYAVDGQNNKSEKQRPIAGGADNARPATETGVAYYNHYGTPAHTIDASIYQGMSALDPNPGPPHNFGELENFFRHVDYPFYNHPVASSGGYIPADTSVTGGLTKFDFRNTRAQETYIFELFTQYIGGQGLCGETPQTNVDQHKTVTGAPYPFNNWDGQDYPSGNGFKRVPCDSSSYSDQWFGSEEPEKNRTTTTYYVALKRTLLNQYGPVDDIIYVETDAELQTGDFTIPIDVKIFGGDSFVDKFVFRKTHYSGCCSGDDGGTENHRMHSYKRATGICHFVECDYNPVFRDAPDDDRCKRYAPYGPVSFGIDKGHGYGDKGGFYQDAYLNIEPFAEEFWKDASSKTPFRSGCLDLCHNYYSYNPDFSAMNVLKKFYPLSQAYKYIGTYNEEIDNCNQCYFNFATRIAYSEKSFQEERADHFRKFLANNYKDVPGETGSITKLLTQSNKLYANTEEASWILQTSQQTMKTDTTVLYIGTGDFLSLPPQKMGDTEVGYGGSVSQWATLKTELGVFIVDERAQKIFLLGAKGLQPIYNIGMRNWFENNMRYNLIQQLNFLGYTDAFGKFPYQDAPNNYVGIGFHAVYDTRHSRYILTKRDYEFVTTILPGYTESPQQMVQNWIEGTPGTDKLELVDNYPDLYWRFNPVAGPTVKLGLPELHPDFFVDKSWTISYSGLNAKWVSFHSYRPTGYITGKNNFYSVWNSQEDDPTKIYIHNTIPYHTFYEDPEGNPIEFPHILELVNVKNPLQTTVYDNYHFLSEATEYNGPKQQDFDIREVTFNKVILYNEHQCTNIVSLANKNRNQVTMQQNAILNKVGEIALSRDERSWAFDGFRDLLQNRTIPIFSEEQSDKFADPLMGAPLGGYADKVVNPPAFINPVTLSPLLTPLEQQRFRDKYLTIRLFFGNFGEVGVDLQNYKLVTNYIFPTTSLSPR